MDSLPSESPGKSINTGGVAYPFSRGTSWTRNQTGVSCIRGRLFTSWTTKMSFSSQGTGMQKYEVKNTWSNRHIWPWSTKWSRAKANRVLPRECTGHTKNPLPTTQENTLYMDITRWSTPKSDWLCSLQPKVEKLYTVRKKKTGADCGSDHELIIAKFRLKLRK